MTLVRRIGEYVAGYEELVLGALSGPAVRYIRVVPPE